MGLWLWMKSPSKGCYEREMHARKMEKIGQHEMASLYRACLAPSEWNAMGYEGTFGNYRKVRQGVSLCKATNGAYGTDEEKWNLLVEEAEEKAANEPSATERFKQAAE